MVRLDITGMSTLDVNRKLREKAFMYEVPEKAE